MFTIETTARQQSSCYEQHGHGARTHAEGARQPVFGKATAKIDCNAAAVAAYALLLGNEDPYDSDSDSAS